ncbi:MAG TPA: hypothetical protein VMB75_04555 [Rhodocyclaceae bacterium]|nr:hypothetical protein [Rhodocyclaceae bacterium]
MATGVLVGLAVALPDASTAAAAGAAVLIGGFLGAMVGILSWCESADLPDDPVLPPAEDQR